MRCAKHLRHFVGRATKWRRMMLRSENSWFRQPGVAEVAEHGVKFGTGLSIFIAFIIDIVLHGWCDYSMLGW